MFEKEAIEIAYIVDCLKENRRVDSLIEWKLSTDNEKMISYKYKRDRLVFFKFVEDSGAVFLKFIDYYHRSLEKMIFLSDTLNNFKVSNLTRFGVWMSNDKLSTYFCMISPDNILIWVLTDGNTVYSKRLELN